MKFGRVLVSVCLGVACASALRAQESVGTSAPPRVLQTREPRAAVLRLKSGETLACNFLRADDERVEVEASGERREFNLDAVASIVFTKDAAEASKPPTPTRAAASSSAPLAVGAKLCETYDRFTALSGQVTNVSPRKITNLTAIGTFRARGGGVLKVEQQLIGDVASGETANFKVMWWQDPRIESCTVSFKIFGGRPVAHTEALER